MHSGSVLMSRLYAQCVQETGISYLCLVLFTIIIGDKLVSVLPDISLFFLSFHE